MCRIITLNDQRVESSSWNDIFNIVKSEEKADTVFDSMLKDDFMDWYGEDWVRTGIEPIITSKGIQNVFGTEYKEFDSTIPVNGLNTKLQKFIKEAGVKIKFVDAIKESLGDNATAVVNFMDLTLQLVEGKIADIELAEEAAHIYTKYVEQEDFTTYSALYNKVTSYPEYKEVKETYALEYGDNEKSYRDEAIGRVIANRIINKSKNPDTFISLAWNKIKAIVKKAFDIQSDQFRTIFDIAANDIVNSDKHFKIRPSEGKLFHLETNTNKAIVDKILQEDALLTKAITRSDKDGQLRESYVRLGKNVLNRVTEWVKKKQNFSKKFTEEDQRVNDLKSAFGTKMHMAADNVAKRYLAKKAGKPLPPIYTGINTEYYRLLEDYVLKILTRPEFSNADVITEVQLYDSKRDLAGTVDILIIDNNGVAHILDYKFITSENKKIYVKPYKRVEWDEQIKLYKSILANNYGITKFGMMRMLPIGITYNDNTEAVGVNINNESIFEKAVPSSIERTGDVQLDKLIDNLYQEAYRLRNNKRISYEDKESRLRGIDSTINSIKVKKDLKSLQAMVNAELDEVESLLSQEKVTSTDVSRMMHLAEYYADIDLNLELPELEPMARRARNLKIEFKKQLSIWATTNNIEFAHVKPVTSFLSNLVSLGSIENPIFRFANNRIQSAQDKKYKETEELRKFFESLNITSFDSILDKSKGKLIAEYNKEFYNKAQDADSKWIRDNVEVREFVTVNGVKVNAKEHFDKRLARKIEQLNKFSPEIKDEEIDKFRRYNDVWSEEYKYKALSYYRGSHKYIQPKEKWFSDEYKALLANKDSDIFKFYTKIKEIIDEANLYSNKHIDSRFLPSIEKSMIKKFVDGSFNPVAGAKEMLDSFKIHEYDVNDKVRELMINYTSNIDKDSISYELKETFLLFADSVYNVKYMSEIEDDLYLSEQLLKNSNYIKVDNLGRVSQDITGNPITESGEGSKLVKETVDKFNKFIDNNVYGLKENAETELGGLGVNKVLGGALTYNAWLKIGGNLLSATSNLVGGKTNQFMEAAKGRFFTTKELASAERSFWSRDAKAMAIIDYFDISTDNNIRKKSRNLKISELDKQFNSDWIMLLQNSTEKITQYTTLIAYTKGMTIKDGKIVKKGKDDVSLYNSITVNNNTVTFPELTDSLYGRARLTVTELNSRLTGAKYDRSKMLYEGDIKLRAISQFKSWVLPMAKERFGSLTYNDNLGFYEEGRATAALTTIFSKHYQPVLKGYLKALVTFNSRAIVIGSEAALKERYESFIKINPNFDPNINKEGGISLEQYTELYHQNIKSFLRELQLWGLMLTASLSYSSTDDDDKNKTIVKFLDRFNNELSYFYSLDSYMALGGISIPLITTASDFTNFTKEVLSNAWAVGTGDSELLSPEKLRKKATKITFGWNQWDRLYNDFIKE